MTTKATLERWTELRDSQTRRLYDRIGRMEKALQEIVEEGERLSGFQCKCLAMEGLGIED